MAPRVPRHVHGTHAVWLRTGQPGAGHSVPDACSVLRGDCVAALQVPRWIQPLPVAPRRDHGAGDSRFTGTGNARGNGTPLGERRHRGAPAMEDCPNEEHEGGRASRAGRLPMECLLLDVLRFRREGLLHRVVGGWIRGGLFERAHRSSDLPTRDYYLTNDDTMLAHLRAAETAHHPRECPPTSVGALFLFKTVFAPKSN